VKAGETNVEVRKFVLKQKEFPRRVMRIVVTLSTAVRTGGYTLSLSLTNTQKPKAMDDAEMLEDT
jgi:hypothetical protein